MSFVTDSSQPFWFLGGQSRVLIPGQATAGSLSVVEFTDGAGHAPPLHIHEDEEEVWIVLDGEVSFFVGDRRIELGPGDAAHGPRGVPHSYLVRSPTARLAAVFAPPGSSSGSWPTELRSAPRTRRRRGSTSTR
ncbi:cupin domain-containing protein [Catenulispora yoronensis]